MFNAVLILIGIVLTVAFLTWGLVQYSKQETLRRANLALMVLSNKHMTLYIESVKRQRDLIRKCNELRRVLKESAYDGLNHKDRIDWLVHYKITDFGEEFITMPISREAVEEQVNAMRITVKALRV